MGKIRLTSGRGCCGVLVLVPFFIILISCGILPLINPIRRSESTITESLLKQTPIGTPRDEVKTFISEQGWPMGIKFWGIKTSGEETAEEREEKERWLDCRLGTYVDFPDFETVVDAEWHFDKTGKLESIKVRKRWANAL